MTDKPFKVGDKVIVYDTWSKPLRIVTVVKATKRFVATDDLFEWSPRGSKRGSASRFGGPSIAHATSARLDDMRLHNARVDLRIDINQLQRCITELSLSGISSIRKAISAAMAGSR